MVALPSCLTRTAFSADQPVDISPEPNMQSEGSWISSHRYLLFKWGVLVHQTPTLSDMLSVMLRSMQSLGPVDCASANRSLVIAFMTRLVNW